MRDLEKPSNDHKMGSIKESAQLWSQVNEGFMSNQQITIAIGTSDVVSSEMAIQGGKYGSDLVLLGS